jgi:hypothetical protein
MAIEAVLPDHWAARSSGLAKALRDDHGCPPLQRSHISLDACKIAFMSHPIHDAAFLIVLILFWLIPAVLIARLARTKGHSFGLFLIASLVIAWPIPLIVALVMPARHDRAALAPMSS